MFSRLFGTANPKPAYQPLPLEDKEANTAAFNHLPKEVLIIIASYVAAQGDWKDVIAFFLTNKHTFDTFKDQDRLGELTVTIQPRNNENNYYWGYAEQPEPWDVVLKNVNYVLLANYYQELHLDQLRPEQAELKNKVENRECISMGIGIAIGTVCGAAVGAGLGYECHTVISPACLTHPSSSAYCDCCNSPCCVMANKIMFEDILCCLPCTFMGFALPVLATDCIKNNLANYNQTRFDEISLQINSIESRIAAYNVYRLPANQRIRLFHINNKTREKRLSSSPGASAPEGTMIDHSGNESHIPPRIEML